MGHQLQSPLDWVHPDFAVPGPPDYADLPWTFISGDHIYAKNYAGDMTWTPAVVIGVSGPRSYQVVLEDGRLWHQHTDQLRHQSGNKYSCGGAQAVGPENLQQPSDIGPQQPEWEMEELPANLEQESTPHCHYRLL